MGLSCDPLSRLQKIGVTHVNVEESTASLPDVPRGAAVRLGSSRVPDQDSLNVMGGADKAAAAAAVWGPISTLLRLSTPPPPPHFRKPQGPKCPCAFFKMLFRNTGSGEANCIGEKAREEVKLRDMMTEKQTAAEKIITDAMANPSPAKSKGDPGITPLSPTHTSDPPHTTLISVPASTAERQSIRSIVIELSLVVVAIDLGTTSSGYGHAHWASQSAFTP
ncbi:heat shock 70 kDa protein 12A isoform X1 [Lates japonicus]|uniref:Heat shock 70 kDa protein 12A isoform X1 n=1 Tax=Lates japonicus TaxID=270547 RepID=A0AAD3RCA0_LATJO|nr:heat shock 70 kDa protein 12A isoform X1 [Lates japonicus]